MLSEQVKKLALGYIRVSTKGQNDQGQSLDAQTARIINYALEKGLTLGGIYDETASATPGKPDARPVFLQAIYTAKAESGALVVTDVDRLSRSYEEVKRQIIAADIPVHVVSLNRLVGRRTLMKLAKEAETAGAKIGQNTTDALAGKSAGGIHLGATAKTLRKATATSLRNRSEHAWHTVIDIAIFISADPIRRGWTKRELVAALNDAGIRTTRGNRWTMDSLTRPLRNAKAHIRLQDEPNNDLV